MKTAVDFAVEKLEKFIPSGNQIAIEAILEQAKEMEKNQIVTSYNEGKLSVFKSSLNSFWSGIEYFSDTYKNVSK